VDGPAEGGWQVINAWETRADFERWSENEVKPNLRSDQAGAVSVVTDLAHVILC